MAIEFRQTRPGWWHVLVDDVDKGWICEDGGLYKATLWLNHRELDFSQGYGSLETAKRKVSEHYEACMDFPEIIGG